MDELLQQIERLSPSAPLIAMGAVFVLGFVLWLLGGRLVKPAAVVGGLAVGSVSAYLVAAAISEEGPLFLLGMAAVGGLIGVLLAVLLFRVWVGLAAALLLGLAAPAVVLAWQGGAPPDSSQANGETALPADESRDAIVEGDGREDRGRGDARSLRDSARDAALELAPSLLPADGEAPTSLQPSQFLDLTDEQKDAGRQVLEQAQNESIEALESMLDRRLSEARAWWDAGAGGTQRTVYAAGAGAAAAGLVGGLLLPKTLAGAIAAAIGAVLMVVSGGELLTAQAPDFAEGMPGGARSTILAVGLITLLGVVVQWALRRRKAEKKD